MLFLCLFHSTLKAHLHFQKEFFSMYRENKEEWNCTRGIKTTRALENNRFLFLLHLRSLPGQKPQLYSPGTLHSSPKRLQPLCRQFTRLKPLLPPWFSPWGESCLFCRELVNCPTCSLRNNCKEKTFQSCCWPRMLPLSSGFIVIGSLRLPGRQHTQAALRGLFSHHLSSVCMEGVG